MLLTYFLLLVLCKKSRPDKKGIKTTQECSLSPHQLCKKSRPDKKGIKTRTKTGTLPTPQVKNHDPIKRGLRRTYPVEDVQRGL